MKAVSGLVLFLGVVATPMTSTAAQSRHWGIAAGLTASSVHYNMGSSHDDRNGPTGGLTWRAPVRGLGSLASGLFISVKGYSGSQSLRLTYLELPVLLQVHTRDPAARIVPYLAAGAAFAALVECDRTLSLSTGPYSAGCGASRTGPVSLEGIRGGDVGADFRFGIRFGRAPGALVLETRFVRGLVDLVAGRTQKNSMGALTVGYEW